MPSLQPDYASEAIGSPTRSPAENSAPEIVDQASPDELGSDQSGSEELSSDRLGSAAGQAILPPAPAAVPEPPAISGARVEPWESPQSSVPTPSLAEPATAEIVGDRYSEPADLFGLPADDLQSSPVPAQVPLAIPAADPVAADAATAAPAISTPGAKWAEHGPPNEPIERPPSGRGFGNAKLDFFGNSIPPVNDPATAVGSPLPATVVPAAEVPAAAVSNSEAPNSEAFAADVPASDVPFTDEPLSAEPATEVPLPEVTAGAAPDETWRSNVAPRTAPRMPATSLPKTDAPSNSRIGTLLNSESTKTEAAQQEDSEAQAEIEFGDLFGPAASSPPEDSNTNPADDLPADHDSTDDDTSGSDSPGASRSGNSPSAPLPSRTEKTDSNRGRYPLGAEFSDRGDRPAVLAQAGGLLSAAVRTWSDDTSSFQCQARLVQVTAKQVILRQASGAQITVSFRRLGHADLQFVHQQVVALRLVRARDATAEKLAIAWAR